MAISTKRKRKIIVADKTFYWYVTVNDDNDAPDFPVVETLHVHFSSPDKKIWLNYDLNQSKSPYLLSDGRVPFVSYHLIGVVVLLANVSGGKQRGLIQTPVWLDDGIGTPAFVRRLIDWWLVESTPKIAVDRQGNPL